MCQQPVSSLDPQAIHIAHSDTHVTLPRRFDCNSNNLKLFSQACTTLHEQHSDLDVCCDSSSVFNDIPFVHVNFCNVSAHLNHMFSWRYVQGTSVGIVSDCSNVVSIFILVVNDISLSDGYYAFTSHAYNAVSLQHQVSEELVGSITMGGQVWVAIPTSCSSCQVSLKAEPALSPRLARMNYHEDISSQVRFGCDRDVLLTDMIDYLIAACNVSIAPRFL